EPRGGPAGAARRPRREQRRDGPDPGTSIWLLEAVPAESRRVTEPTPERQFPDMWVDPDDDPRDTGSTPRGEKAVLAEYLDHFRMTFEMKCEGLDAEQLAQRSVPPSSMSLLGLVRHLASVEFHWFRRF